MEDISDLAPLVKSTPEQAANNISNANLFSVDPRYAAENKSIFDEKASQILKPQQAEAPVANYARQSPEHAAVIEPDVEKLSWMARQKKMISDYVFDRPTTEHEIIDLNLKKMNSGGKLDLDDEIKLLSANHDAQDQATRNYGLDGPIQQLPAYIAGGISDFGQSLVRGARKGILEGPLGNLPPKMIGKFAPLAAGGLYYGTMVKDPFDTLSASMYNELSNMNGPDGQPKNLDHDTKLAYSRGVGLVGVALMNGAGYAVAKTTPFLKPFMNPALMKGMINSPTKAAVLVGLGNALKGSAAVGAASGFTEVARILTEEMGKANGTDEAGFWNALSTAATKANASRVASATGSGMAMGAMFELPLQLAGFGRTKQQFQEGFNQYLHNLPESRDVTPESLKALPGAKTPAAPDIDVTPGGQGPGGGQFEESFKAIQLNEALHQINDVQKSTNVNTVAPGELSEVNKQGFAAAGMNKLFMNIDALRGWAKNEEQGLAARKLLDASGLAASQMNAPFEVDSHKVMEIAKEYPDILDHVQYKPDGMSGMQAKEYVEALGHAEEQRKELMGKLGITPEEVQPDSNVSELRIVEKKPEIPYDLESAVYDTQQLLNQKKRVQEELDQYKDLDEVKQPRDVISINDKPVDKELQKKLIEEGVHRSTRANELKQELADYDKQIAEIKDRVANHLKENPPGSVLSFPFDEAEAARKAELAYGRAPTFTEAIAKVLPPEAVAKYNSAQLDARQTVVEMVHDAAIHEMNKIVNQTMAMAKEDVKLSELERIAHDPNYATVDQFHSHQIANSKGNKKRSIYSIDPETLPKDLVHFLDSPQLKEHKVFAKGGMSVDDSAKALGFATGKDLLEILSKTPSRKQILKARSQFYNADIEKMAKAGVDLDHTNIMKAFTDRTRAHIEEMRFMREQNWPDTKFGIKKIALPLPRMEDIENESHATALKMKVGSLSPAQYVVGERQSQRIAVHSILENKVEKAFQAKEAAARNSAMQKEVRKMIALVNRAQKFFRMIEEPSAQAIMRAAGKTASNALDEITDVFNMNPRRKGQSEKDSFNKWVRREVKAGRGDFSIPERLSDVRESIDEMTVEQVLAAHDRAKTIFNEARFKAELIENKDMREEERSVDHIAEEVMLQAAEHPGENDANFKDVQGNDTNSQKIRYFLQDAHVAFSNMEHTLRYYDQGKNNGFFQQTFMHQLKGDGKWEGKMGGSKENAMIHKFAKRTREIMDNHGDYENVEKKRLNIPEFADFPSLSNGQLTKGDLMTFWAYKGDPDGRAKLQSNFKDSNGKGIMLDTWQKVFDRELTKADVTAMQYAVDMYKDYQEETRDLQNRTKGEDVVFVKGILNEHQGQFYPGGYVPNKHKHEWSAKAAKRALEILENKKAAWYEKGDGAEFGRQYGAEQTEQGRTIERTDSTLPLDGSLLRFWRGHEEVIHDLSYREPTMNLLKLLKDKRIRESMIKMGGEARFNLLLNTVINKAGQAEEINANYFSDQNRFFKSMFGYLQNRFNFAVLGFNIFTSTPIQYTSLGQVSLNMGPKGTKHFAMINTKIATHPHLWGGVYNWAKEIDPSVGHFLDQLQNKIESQVADLVPRKSFANRIPGAAIAKGLDGWITHLAMSPMALADIHIKVMTAPAAYAQFMAGDADNWPLEKVMALPEKERYDEAVAYARQISRLSLTHGKPEDQAPFQRTVINKFFSNYWNDGRNALNNQINAANRVKWKAEAGNAALGQSGGSGFGGGKGPPTGPGMSVNEMTNAKDGGGSNGGERLFDEDKRGFDAAGYFGTAAGLAMFTIAIATMSRWYQDKIRGIQQTPDQWPLDFKTAEGRKQAAEKMGQYMMFSPLDQLATDHPLIRDVFFAEQMPDKVKFGFVDRTKTVQLPIMKQFSDMATSAKIVSDAIEESNNLTEFVWYLTNLDNKESKTVLNTLSLGLPIPVNAYTHMMRVLDLPLNSPSRIGPTALEKVKKGIGEFFDRQVGDNPLKVDPNLTADLEKINKEITPEVATIPPGTTEVFKQAVSGGDWRHMDGIYGFTSDQWKKIQKAAPDLGLTDSGRISKDVEQQEKAADWQLHEDAHELSSRGLPVNQNTLFGSFKIGIEDYEKLYRAPADTKLKTALGQGFLEKHPELSTSKTVGQLRLYLINNLDRGKKAAGTQKLTPTASNNED